MNMVNTKTTISQYQIISCVNNYQSIAFRLSLGSAFSPCSILFSRISDSAALVVVDAPGVHLTYQDEK